MLKGLQKRDKVKVFYHRMNSNLRWNKVDLITSIRNNHLQVLRLIITLNNVTKVWLTFRITFFSIQRKQIIQRHQTHLIIHNKIKKRYQHPIIILEKVLNKVVAAVIR